MFSQHSNTSTNCRGRLGCQWCFQFPNKTDALDNQKYCEYKTKKCFPSSEIPKIPISENKNTDIVIGISISVLVVAVVIAILLFCFFKSKRNEARESIPVSYTSNIQPPQQDSSGALRNRNFENDHNDSGEVIGV